MVADTTAATNSRWNVGVDVTDAALDIMGMIFQRWEDGMDGSRLDDGNKHLARRTQQTPEACGANRKQGQALLDGIGLNAEQDSQGAGTRVNKRCDVRLGAEVAALTTKVKVELTPGGVASVLGAGLGAEAAANEMSEGRFEGG